MNEKELIRLLEKYYNGESSEDEERILRDFFSREPVPEGYETEREIFGYFKREGEIPQPSPGFEERIMAGIDLPGEETGSPSLRRFLLPLLGAAASILILAGSWFFLAGREKGKDTFNDPQIAYSETRKILYDISVKMNRATLPLEPVGKMNEMSTRSFSAISKSAGIIEKSLKSLENLQDAEILSDQEQP